MNRRASVLIVLLTAAAAAMGLVLPGCAAVMGLKKKPAAFENSGAAPARTPVYHLGGWTIARATLHNHTIYSDGCYSTEDLLEFARQEGMAVLSFNDHREGKICAEGAGLCFKIGGVESVGYDVYFDHLRRIQETARDQGMIALKGIEVIPYMYNYGKLPALVIDGAQEHFTVYGIEDAAVFNDMPVRNSVAVRPEAIPDEKPWQDFVDYIVEHGGIVDAVHLEDGADMWYGPAHGACPPPADNLHRIKRLTGFSAMPSGWREKTGGPGGWWDTDLAEYMAALRQAPVWAIADTDYHCDQSMAIANTLLYMREFTEQEVLRCMREGRMVALMGDAFQDSYVSEWWVSDGGMPEDPIMLGATATVKTAPTVRFALDHDVAGTRARLIRNGVVVMEQDGSELTFIDQDQGKNKEPAFYRVEVIGPRQSDPPYNPSDMRVSELFVNPIFVKFAR
ncbi:MAG TPA: hypothetical protein VM658_19850 [bacterium]|nr:hypothetical protein [bacterium]